MSALALTRRDGKVVDVMTAAVLDAAAELLGYELTVVQGSPNRGVGASAGSHDWQGVADLAPFDQARKVRVLRSLGCAAWFRPAIPGLWGPHIHLVVIGHPHLHPTAARQVTAYLAGRNGLRDNGRDTGPRGFTTVRFVWPPKPDAPEQLTRVQRADQLLARAGRLLAAAATVGKRHDLVPARKTLRRVRRRLPQR